MEHLYGALKYSKIEDVKLDKTHSLQFMASKKERLCYWIKEMGKLSAIQIATKF